MVHYVSSENETKNQKIRATYQPILGALNRPEPTPFRDEEEDDYRLRCLSALQPAIRGFEDLRIDKYLRPENVDYIEKQMFEAARQEARSPTRVPDGELREVRRVDQSGRPILEFFGKPSAWMAQFMPSDTKKLTAIRTENTVAFDPNTAGGWRRP